MKPHLHVIRTLIEQSGGPDTREEMHNELYNIVADSKRRTEASVHSNTATVTVQSERGQSAKPDTTPLGICPTCGHDSDPDEMLSFGRKPDTDGEKPDRQGGKQNE